MFHYRCKSQGPQTHKLLNFVALSLYLTGLDSLNYPIYSQTFIISPPRNSLSSFSMNFRYETIVCHMASGIFECRKYEFIREMNDTHECKRLSKSGGTFIQRHRHMQTWTILSVEIRRTASKFVISVRAYDPCASSVLISMHTLDKPESYPTILLCHHQALSINGVLGSTTLLTVLEQKILEVR